MSSSKEEESEAFKVYIRVRPILEKEKILMKSQNRLVPKNILTIKDNTITALDTESGDALIKKDRTFAFDDVFNEETKNKDIFEKIVRTMVDNVLSGYNSTAMAYGVTGSGKTHTMFGDIYSSSNLEKGICVYAVDSLFDNISSITSFDENRKFDVKLSYLEIYNEQVIDLLVPNSKNLMIIEDPNIGLSVPDLSEYQVKSTSEILKLIIHGNDRRTMAPTGQNEFSSRSHALIKIEVEQVVLRETKTEVIRSRLMLVDLAGSERGGLEKGIRTQEGGNINKSLLALGSCINMLSDKTKKGSFVPYRDSKLTRLLKESLSGNTKTIMIACVYNSSQSYDEVVNTLKYAAKAKKIEKKITKNIKELEPQNNIHLELIERLQAEIEGLKGIINSQNLLLESKNYELSQREEKANGKTVKTHIGDTIKTNQQVNTNLERKKSQVSNCESDRIKDNTVDKYDLFNESHINQNFAEDEEKVEKVESKEHEHVEKIAENTNLGNEIPKDTITFPNFEGYKTFIENMSVNMNIDELERQIDNLENDKKFLETKMEEGIKNELLSSNYNMLKIFVEKYLDLVNQKLEENIEEHMILKYNMKEILDLNQTNNNNLTILFSQIYNIENIILDKPEEEEKMEGEINMLKEEAKNIQKAIDENETLKKSISSSLEKNTRFKKILKKIQGKIISNSQSKDLTNLQQAYRILENEKKYIDSKNQKFQKYLSSVLKDKQVQDTKIIELERELKKIKDELKNKDEMLQEVDGKLIVNLLQKGCDESRSKPLTVEKLEKNEKLQQGGNLHINLNNSRARSKSNERFKVTTKRTKRASSREKDMTIKDLEENENYISKDEINLHTESQRRVNNVYQTNEKKFMKNITDNVQVSLMDCGRSSNLTTPQSNKKGNIPTNYSSKLVTSGSNKHLNSHYSELARKRNNQGTHNRRNTVNEGENTVCRKPNFNPNMGVFNTANTGNILEQSNFNEPVKICIDLNNIEHSLSSEISPQKPIIAETPNNPLKNNKNFSKNTYQNKYISLNQHGMNKLTTNSSKDVSLSLSTVTYNNEVVFSSENEKDKNQIEQMITRNRNKKTNIVNNTTDYLTEQAPDSRELREAALFPQKQENKKQQSNLFLNKFILNAQVQQQQYPTSTAAAVAQQHAQQTSSNSEKRNKSSDKIRNTHLTNSKSSNPVTITHCEGYSKLPKQYDFENISKIAKNQISCISTKNLPPSHNNPSKNASITSIPSITTEDVNVNNITKHSDNLNKMNSLQNDLSKARLERQLKVQQSKGDTSTQKDKNSSEQFINSYISHKKDLIRSETMEGDGENSISIVNLRNQSRSRSRGKREMSPIDKRLSKPINNDNTKCIKIPTDNDMDIKEFVSMNMNKLERFSMRESHTKNANVVGDRRGRAPIRATTDNFDDDFEVIENSRSEYPGIGYTSENKSHIDIGGFPNIPDSYLSNKNEPVYYGEINLDMEVDVNNIDVNTIPLRKDLKNAEYNQEEILKELMMVERTKNAYNKFKNFNK